MQLPTVVVPVCREEEAEDMERPVRREQAGTEAHPALPAELMVRLN